MILHSTQNQLKMDERLDIRLETIKLLEENIGDTLLGISLGDFLDLTQKQRQQMQN